MNLRSSGQQLHSSMSNAIGSSREFNPSRRTSAFGTAMSCNFLFLMSYILLLFRTVLFSATGVRGHYAVSHVVSDSGIALECVLMECPVILAVKDLLTKLENV